MSLHSIIWNSQLMLDGQAFNAITYNWRLKVLSVIHDKQKAKNVKDQGNFLEKSSLYLLGRVFRDHVKQITKFKKECKESYIESKTKERAFSKGLPFS